VNSESRDDKRTCVNWGKNESERLKTPSSGSSEPISRKAVRKAGERVPNQSKTRGVKHKKKRLKRQKLTNKAK